MNNLLNTIQALDPISLEEMDSVKLMNRTDTKFAFPVSLLPEILEQCKSDYRILDIDGVRTANYKTLYFDTENFNLFLDHHNEKAFRYKVRIRNYVESKLFYLEAKLKVKGRTVKSRIKLKDFEDPLSERAIAFLEKTTGSKTILKPALWNSFKRITLVNRKEKERLTIDFSLTFTSGEKNAEVNNLVIAEVKQENRNRYSKIIEILRTYHIRESGLSKYCIGLVLLKPGIKYNNFKSKILYINKITKAA